MFKENELDLFMKKYPVFAAYGFHKGFGQMLFNSIIQSKPENNDIFEPIARKLLEMQILRVRDTEYNRLADKLIDDYQKHFVAAGGSFNFYYLQKDLQRNVTTR